MSTRNLGTLTADLILKLGGFAKGMDQAARESERSMKRIRSSVALAQRALAAFGVGFSAVAIGRELVQSARAAIQFGDEIGKAMDKTGIGAEALTELAFAAKQNEVELDSLTTALRNMQVVISDASVGNKAAVQTLKDLGLTFQELKALKPEDQFSLIAQRISEFSSEADRSAVAQDVFKRAGLDLLPVLADGAEGIRKYREEARKLGATLSEEQVAAFEKADEAIDSLSAAYQGATRSLTALVAIPLAGFFDGITASIIRANDESLTFADRAGLIVEAYKRAFAEEGLFAGPQDLANAYAKITEEANKAAAATKQFGSLAETLGLRQVGGTRTRTDRDAEGTKKVASEAEKARDRIDELILSLREQVDTFGLSEAAALKYSITQGKLAEDFDRLGEAGNALRDELLRLSEIPPQQEATRAIEEQIRALEEQAATLGMTEEEVLAYSLAHGELSRQLDLTGEAEDRLRARYEASVAAITAAREALELEADSESFFDATRTDAEKYGETVERLGEILDANAGFQDTYNRAVGDAVLQYIQGADAAETYKNQLDELFRLQHAGLIDPAAFAEVRAKIEEQYRQAGKEAADAFRDEAKRGTQNILAEFFTDFDSKNILEDFNQLFRQIAAQALAARIADKLFNGIDGWFSKIGEAFAGLGGGGGGDFWGKLGTWFAGLFDKGGTIPQGKVGIVGERRPEIAYSGISPFEIIRQTLNIPDDDDLVKSMRPSRVCVVGQSGAEALVAKDGPIHVVPMRRFIDQAESIAKSVHRSLTEQLDDERYEKAAQTFESTRNWIATSSSVFDDSVKASRSVSDSEWAKSRRVVDLSESVSRSINQSLTKQIDTALYGNYRSARNTLATFDDRIDSRSEDRSSQAASQSIENVLSSLDERYQVSRLHDSRTERRSIFDLVGWSREIHNSLASFVYDRLESISSYKKNNESFTSLKSIRDVADSRDTARKYTSSLISDRDESRTASLSTALRQHASQFNSNEFRTSDIRESVRSETVNEVLRSITETFRKRSIFDLVGIMRELRQIFSQTVSSAPAPIPAFAIGGAMDVRPGGMLHGPGTPTSDSMLLWGSTKEFMVRAKAAQQPGAPAFLDAFNRGHIRMESIRAGLEALMIAPKLAMGGFTSPVSAPQMSWNSGMAAPAINRDGQGAAVVNQYFQFPGVSGSVSRQTEMQITAAAARGVKNADRRNN